MAQKQQRSLASALGLSVRDVLYIAGLLVTLGMNIARTNDLGEDLRQFKEKYATEVVPRQEHVQMNNVTEERWRAVNDQLQQMRGQLKDIKDQQDRIIERQQHER